MAARTVITVRISQEIADALPAPSLGGKKGRSEFIRDALMTKLAAEGLIDADGEPVKARPRRRGKAEANAFLD